jgi:DNA polymerase-3 subunit gamma/tau
VSIALYRTYRSKSLDEIVGQHHVTDILSRSLAEGHIAHAYLLTGPRGVGKTSIARILAHEINHLPYDDETTHLDIIEIDAASNNKVEDVRDLREKVHIAPVSAAKKIYIIDEVHMLSKSAFNALLKTLEEPPEHAVFILATTDADKLPSTIISRTQRFNFRAITPRDASIHLKSIATAEKIKIDDEALYLIALRGNGSFRDSIGLLDQLRSLTDSTKGITSQMVEEFLGLAPSEQIDELLAAHEAKDLAKIVSLIDASEAAGTQAGALASQLIDRLRTTITTAPQLIPLLDNLLEVAKSSQPSIKLLTVLAAHSIPKQKTVALHSNALEVSAPIESLRRQATKVKPVDPKPIAYKPTHSAKPLRAVSNPVMPDLSNFDWTAFIEHTRKNYVAIYSVLSKCTPDMSDGTFVLYTGNGFYKKKLDDARHRANFLKALAEVGMIDITIETIGTPPPLKDSQAAAVAAIMGGGEEVSIE